MDIKFKLSTISEVVADDGKDGIFYRNGIKYLRNDDYETRWCDTPKELQKKWEEELSFVKLLLRK